MSKIAPFRDEVFRQGDDLRTRLNELVSVVNGTSTRIRHLRLQNVQANVTVTLPAPGFVVGGVLVAGARPTAGGANPTAAPWPNWQQQADGRITCTIGGLSGSALYAVDLVLVENGGTV